MSMIFKKKNLEMFEKAGMKMGVYSTKEDCAQASVVYQETEKGHTEEFYHEKSTFIYYIIAGSGTWVIEDQEHPVETGDVVIIPPGKKFYYKGKLKQICVTAPAWEPQFEHLVRKVEFE